MPQRKIAVIVGASGLVGNNVLKELLISENYSRVIAIGRSRLSVKHEKLEQIISDFEDIDNFDFWTETDVVFCCIGTTIKKAKSQEAFRKVDFDIPVSVIQASEMTKTQFHLISSIGAKKDSSNFYLRTKGELEEYLKLSDIYSIHIYRPSLLLGKRNEIRWGERFAIILNTLFSWLLLGSLKKYKGISVEHLAKVMVRISLQNPEKGIIIHENDELLEL